MGFEPTVGLHPLRFSRPARSTTPPPLRIWCGLQWRLPTRPFEGMQAPKCGKTLYNRRGGSSPVTRACAGLAWQGLRKALPTVQPAAPLRFVMYLRPLLLALLLGAAPAALLAQAAAVPQAAQAETVSPRIKALSDTMMMSDVMSVMRDEGMDYGKTLDTELMSGAGGARCRSTRSGRGAALGQSSQTSRSGQPCRAFVTAW